MAVNMTVQSGVVKSPALRYTSDGKVEYRFTLMQQEKDWLLYLPCFAPGAAGERLHEQLDEGMTIVIKRQARVQKARHQGWGAEPAGNSRVGGGRAD